MDGVSFSPVSSSSLQRRAGRQSNLPLSRPVTLLWQRGPEHMCSSVCVSGERESKVKRRDESLSLRGVCIYSQQQWGRIYRPHREIKCWPQQVNFSSCEYFDKHWLCLHTQIYPLNKIFHPDFRSTHWKYQHSGRGALVRSCPYYGNPETRNRWWWWLVECWRKPLHPPRPPFH